MSQAAEAALEKLRALGIEARPAQAHDYKAARRAFDLDRGCRQKQRHETEAQAHAHIRALKRTGACSRMQWFDIYRCPHCAGYHIARGLPR